MALKKSRKHSSAMGDLQAKTKDQLHAFPADGEAFTQFLNRYVEERAGEREQELLAASLADRRQLLYDLANARPDAEGLGHFWKRWKSTLRKESLEDLEKLATTLRFLWTRPSIGIAEQELDRWLAHRPAAAAPKEAKSSAKARRGSGKKRPKPSDAEGGAEAGNAERTFPFCCSLGAGHLVPDRQDLRAMLIQGVFEHWPRFRICANADCVAPYYVAKRKDQLVCDAEACKAEKQRAHALKWWHEHRGGGREQG